MGQAASRGSNATMIRQIVLVILLLVAAGAAVYDFKVARPAAQKAYDKISEISEQPAPLTAADVQKALGKKPSVTLSGSNSYLEKYTWMSGLVFKTHYVWVVYAPKEPHLFQVHYLNQEVDRQMQHDYESPAVKPGSTPAQPGNVGAASAGAPARQPDPEALNQGATQPDSGGAAEGGADSGSSESGN